jgi:hypothetical protein
MPKLNITDEQAKALVRQPESFKPLLLSRDRVGRLLINEAIEARLAAKREAAKRGDKMPKL